MPGELRIAEDGLPEWPGRGERTEDDVIGAQVPQEKRDELRALHAGATPDEWVAIEHLHAENAVAVKGFERTRRIADIRTDPRDYGRGNARYIAAAANAVIPLLDALEAVEAERDGLLGELRAASSESPQ
ncbi:hypothetical protein [Mycobacteroides chelonae]|nr:hypothetical protein [Mycobacteroides chelonae]